MTAADPGARAHPAPPPQPEADRPADQRAEADHPAGLRAEADRPADPWAEAHSPAGLRAEARRQLDRWRAEGRFEPRSDSWLIGYDEDFSRLLGAHGWIGLTWSKEYGGHDRGFVDRLILTEELLRAGAPVAGHWIADRQIGPAIARLGTGELKHHLLPLIAAGTARFCLGMSEPEAGSDLASVRTRARRVAGGWALDGQKVWSSNAHRATHAYVLARTSPSDDKHRGLSEFVLDVTQPGVTIRRIPDLRGPGHFCEIFLDSAFVPDEWVLGEIGNGWAQVTEQIAYERGGPERVLSTYPLLRLMLDAAGGDGRSGAGGLGAGGFGAGRSGAGGGVPASMAARVGELVARLVALRRLAWQVAVRMDDGEAPVSAAATLKLLGNRFEVDVIEAARQLRPDGIDPAAWRRLVDARDDAVLAAPGFSLRGGTTEMLTVVVGREALRGVR